MVIMAGGIARGRVRTTTSTTELPNMGMTKTLDFTSILAGYIDLKEECSLHELEAGHFHPNL